jgi:hypothetical protein
MKVAIALACLGIGNSLHMMAKVYNVHESIISNIINTFVQFNEFFCEITLKVY